MASKFSLFCYYLPSEQSIALKTLNFPSPKSALCQFCLKFAQRFWRRLIFKVVNVFSLFRYYLLLEMGVILHLIKLESPSPKDALCQVWLKLAQWFWRRFLNFINVILLLRSSLSPIGKLTDFRKWWTTDNRRPENLRWALPLKIDDEIEKQ